MTTDNVFYSEKIAFKKMALLLTIPCAILPIMMATAGMMTAFSVPLFFRFDYYLFGMVYVIYGYGLFLSWKVHRKVYPFIVFFMHLLAVIYFTVASPAGWMSYVVIFSIMLTSVTNQYYRTGSMECDECDNLKMSCNM